MARRRYISTDISTDNRVNQLTKEGGVFATLLYTWMVPHATDDGGITADLDELRLIVVPGIKVTPATMQKSIEAMEALGLIERVNGRLFFPTDTFYKYQNYVSAKNRREVPQNPETAKPKKSPQNPASPSLSPSVTPSVSPSPSDERENAGGREIAAVRPGLAADPEETPFALEYIRRYEQREARPPSPIEKAEARRLERDHGTEVCRQIAADYDWLKKPQYLRTVLEDPNHDKPRVQPSRRTAGHRNDGRDYDVADETERRLARL